MEHETDTQASKFSKVANGKLDSSKIGNASHHHYPDEGDPDGDLHWGLTGGSTTAIVGSSFLGMGEVGGFGGAVGGNRLRDWQHSSRIIRVSRASGGKDRHSKVWTAKGPRDRRVRLSVSTAIQFYDLQDRLGVDQPSKAVEWLIKAASDAISELPSLDSSFPETPRQQISDDKSPGLGGNGNDEQGFDSSAELELDGDPGFVQSQNQHGSNLSKSSACSSTSETSKGSRTEIRVKARERARERTAKDKERDQPVEHQDQHQQQREVNNQQLPQSSSSFTQLLTPSIGNMNNPGVSSSPMNYFSTTGIMGALSSARGASTHHSSCGVSGQIIQLGNPRMHQPMMTVSPFSLGGDQNPHELQHFPFIPDHHLIVPAPSAGGGSAPGSGGDHYNLNFSISPSSGLAAFNNNRGTLQSNSLSSLLPHFQRFPSSQLDGSTLPFFLGAPVENQHQHQNHHPNTGQFPSGLQLCYGDNGGELSDQKGKGKT